METILRKSRVQALNEALHLLRLGVYHMRCIPSEFIKLVDVLDTGQSTLTKVDELRAKSGNLRGWAKLISKSPYKLLPTKHSQVQTYLDA